MALEWVAGDESKGSDLRSWLRRGPLDLKVALSFIIDICRGLQYAEKRVPGIVHRDLKPDNILINQSHQAKITDFGLTIVNQIARVSDSNGIVGTPAYMPPEQWQGDADIDVRADIYAIGCTLFELLTGRWVFDGRTLSEIKAKHLSGIIPDLELKNEQELNLIIKRCLAKDRQDRYPNLQQLLAQLIEVYQNKFHTEPPREDTGFEFSPEDYSNRGLSYLNLEQYERAIVDFDRAIALDPSFAPAYTNKGNALSHYGRFEEGIDNYTESLKLDGNSVWALTNRGVAFIELGLYDQAITDCSKTIALDSSYWQAYHYRSIAYMKIGNDEAAYGDKVRENELRNPDSEQLLENSENIQPSHQVAASQHVSKSSAPVFYISAESSEKIDLESNIGITISTQNGDKLDDSLRI